MTHAEVLPKAPELGGDDWNSDHIWSHVEVLRQDCQTVSSLNALPSARRNFGREAVPAMRYQAGRAEADGTAGARIRRAERHRVCYFGRGRGEIAGPV